LTPSSTTYRIASSITRWQQPSGRPSPEAMPAQATAAGQPAIPPSLRLRQETEADTAEHLAPEHAHAVRMAPRRPGRSARRSGPDPAATPPPPLPSPPLPSPPWQSKQPQTQLPLPPAALSIRPSVPWTTTLILGNRCRNPPRTVYAGHGCA
jgi:hypothetical protein